MRLSCVEHWSALYVNTESLLIKSCLNDSERFLDHWRVIRNSLYIQVISLQTVV